MSTSPYTEPESGRSAEFLAALTELIVTGKQLIIIRLPFTAAPANTSAVWLVGARSFVRQETWPNPIERAQGTPYCMSHRACESRTARGRLRSSKYNAALMRIYFLVATLTPVSSKSFQWWSAAFRQSCSRQPSGTIATAACVGS